MKLNVIALLATAAVALSAQPLLAADEEHPVERSYTKAPDAPKS